MASIWQDPRNGNWLIKFVFAGKPFCKSCLTKNEDDAGRIKARVEETLGMLNTGRLSIPEDADVGVWILSGGKLQEKPKFDTTSPATVAAVCDAYYKDQLDKADTTLEAEKRHIGHLKRILGEKTTMATLTLDAMQNYVSVRHKADNRYGGKVSGQTIKKELTTFMQVWDWGRQRGYIKRPCPFKDLHRPHKWAVKIPKQDKAEGFMTWDEIKRRIARGGLTAQQEKELWKYLYLDEKQVAELLAHVKKAAAHAFIYPMFVLAACTGARRSEICRSMIDDFKFDDEILVIRERKKRKDLAGSSRKVPMQPKLAQAMRDWFKIHPGGQFTIVPPLRMPKRQTKSVSGILTREEAHHHFKQALAGSKWQVVRGFHVLRHSFGAICTRAGIPMNVIAKWMGHTTDEMMKLYQHLFPQDEQAWMKKFPLQPTSASASAPHR